MLRPDPTGFPWAIRPAAVHLLGLLPILYLSIHWAKPSHKLLLLGRFVPLRQAFSVGSSSTVLSHSTGSSVF